MKLNEATRNYASAHADDDVRQLALQGSKDEAVDLTLALQQIAGRQTARRKLPSWAAIDGIVYPPHLNMEQCSSEQTARYKAQVVSTLLTDSAAERGTFVDLTGGFGVDFYWMSQGFRRRVYVEQNAELCDIVESNMRALRHPCSVYRGTASVYLTEGAPKTGAQQEAEGTRHEAESGTRRKTEAPRGELADVVFLDPARRDGHGGRTYGIADCTPNVLELLPRLTKKARFIVMKLSPMLDWRKAVDDLQGVAEAGAYVREVHIVSVDNECKELLLVVSKERVERLHVACVNNGAVFHAVSTAETDGFRRRKQWFPQGKTTARRRPPCSLPTSTSRTAAL